ncbi:3-hydroxyisobutyrate dehydrogenase [Bordetella tumbae]|uniref:NAD(P)-binding domain-containing protein n=1 Tax=Bordetella tumbae TaxID=1649139 RepID=UPI0039F070CE
MADERVNVNAEEQEQALNAVNDVIAAAVLLLNLEVMAMGCKSGLSLTGMLQTINQSSGRSRISELELPMLLAGRDIDNGVLASVLNKVDRAIALGAEAGAAMPIAAGTRALLQIGVNMRGAEAYADSMVDVIGSLAGVSLYTAAERSGQAGPPVNDVPVTASSRKPVIGYVGLGAMGSALAQQALQAASKLYVYDISPSRVQTLVQQGAHGATDLASLAKACDIIMLCVPGAAEVRQTLFGASGMIDGLAPGKIIVDQTTGSPARTRALANELACSGVTLIDAPVAGGPDGARKGSLLSLCGGGGPAYVVVEKVLRAMGSQVTHFGETGNGHAAKLVKNALGACNRLITYEALSMAMRLDLPLDVLAQTVSTSPGWTVAFQRIVPAMKTGAPTADIRLELLAKDLRLICDQAVSCGAPMLIANLVRTSVENAICELGKDANIDELERVFGLDALRQKKA